MEYYGGFYTMLHRGNGEVRQLFSEPGISSPPSTEKHNLDTYPGSQNLYDFIVNSAHLLEDTIML